MDIYCTNCGEPWDLDTLHEEINHRIYTTGAFAPALNEDEHQHYYRIMQREFAAKGCAAFTCYGPYVTCEPQAALSDSGKLTKSAAMVALLEICGDDFDGIASMMDDFEYVGWVE